MPKVQGKNKICAYIGDTLEQNWTNLNFQSLNIVQMIDKYSANIGQILTNIVQTTDKCFANIGQILGDYLVTIV